MFDQADYIAGDTPALQFIRKDSHSEKSQRVNDHPRIHIVGQPFPVADPNNAAGGNASLQFSLLRAA